MNFLGIDYGTKNIGLAVAINGIISPLTVIRNNSQVFEQISRLVKDYQISKIYVGISEGKIALKTRLFVKKISAIINLPFELVEESVSTIEAQAIFKNNRHSSKRSKDILDSVAACVILNRVIS